MAVLPGIGGLLPLGGEALPLIYRGHGRRQGQYGQLQSGWDTTGGGGAAPQVGDLVIWNVFSYIGAGLNDLTSRGWTRIQRQFTAQSYTSTICMHAKFVDASDISTQVWLAQSAAFATVAGCWCAYTLPPGVEPGPLALGLDMFYEPTAAIAPQPVDASPLSPRAVIATGFATGSEGVVGATIAPPDWEKSNTWINSGVDMSWHFKSSPGVSAYAIGKPAQGTINVLAPGYVALL